MITALLLINAVFAGSEIALISLREGQLRQLERRGGRTATILVGLARDPNRFLATIQIGITLSGYLASAAAAVTLAQPLVAGLGFLGTAAPAVAVGLVTLILAFITLVVGELAPKRLAMQHAQRWSLLVARPLNVISVISRPVVWLLSKATNLVVRLLGGDPNVRQQPPTAEELRDLVAGHRGLTKEQRMIISGALEINERTLREVVVPRRSVVTLPAELPIRDARTTLAEAGHQRAPVVHNASLDDVVGVVHLRDLLDDDGITADAARPVVRFPDSLRVSEALRRFKADREQFAVVLDEHGGAEGIITLEDLLEEIVGEIYDEADSDVQQVQNLPDGSVLLPGTFPIHDLSDIGVDLGIAAEGDFTTIAGLVLVALGRIPTGPGDRVEVPNWTIEVTAVDKHAITEVHLLPRRSPEPDDA
ncbi:hemolysin family protein [Mycolicibacterium thermoresistibile]